MSAILNAEEVRPVVIVGGGISGLAVAFHLAQRAIPSTLIERSGHLGGLVRTHHWNGCDLEAGPDSFIANKVALLELATELGIASQIIPSNEAARRTFIAKQGRLVPMPPGMVLMVPSDLTAAHASELFSAAAKQQFEAELTMSPRTRERDVSVSDFILDHFGSEIFATVAEPLLAGVYGGDGSLLSARSVLPKFLEYEGTTGSLIRAVQAERHTASSSASSVFRSFAGGMQTLVDALQAAIHPYCEVMQGEVQTALPSGTGFWKVLTNHGEVKGRHLAMACPAHTQAAILSTSVPDLAAHLGAIPYSSALLATYVYDCGIDAPDLNGFGFLVPHAERHTIAAATFISTKFPSRIPPHLRAVRVFMVGKQAEALVGLSDEKLSMIAEADLRRFLAIDGSLIFRKVDRWPQSMPQYVVGHGARYQQIEQILARTSNLHLCGNAFEGVGLPDCARLAKRVASQIAGCVA